MGRLPLPPQRPGRQPLSFHQLIIFTNLQPRKKVHSGLNNLGREPCGREEAWRLESGDLGQRPLPACIPCRSFRLQTQALPSPASATALRRKAALLSGPGRSPLCYPHALPPQALGSWPGAACNPSLNSPSAECRPFCMCCSFCPQCPSLPPSGMWGWWCVLIPEGLSCPGISKEGTCDPCVPRRPPDKGKGC